MPIQEVPLSRFVYDSVEMRPIVCPNPHRTRRAKLMTSTPVEQVLVVFVMVARVQIPRVAIVVAKNGSIAPNRQVVLVDSGFNYRVVVLWLAEYFQELVNGQDEIPQAPYSTLKYDARCAVLIYTGGSETGSIHVHEIVPR
jgi:hypothetical protein